MPTPYRARRNRVDAARRKRRKAENRALSDTLKETLGCEITGQKLPANSLEWHHCDPTTKHRNMSDLLRRSQAAFAAELAKCICVSAAVHAALHQAKSALPSCPARGI